MGIDASLRIATDEALDKKSLRHLQYRLMERFGKEMFSWNKEVKDFILPVSADRLKYENSEFENFPISHQEFVYGINLVCRHYGRGYERGPGLKIAALCLLLNKLQYQVFYGGDELYRLYSYGDSLALLNHWLEMGHIPYDSHHKSNIECSFCMTPMIWAGSFGGGNIYRCSGCDEEYKDETYKIRERKSGYQIE